jgi:hypothetical protein
MSVKHLILMKALNFIRNIIMNNTYAELRSTIKSGDILAWTNRKVEKITDLSLQVIRLFTKSEYVHVGTAWVVGERVFVIEAVIPLVRIYPLSSLLPFFLINTNAPWTEETENFALSVVGENYSLSQAMFSLFQKPNLDDVWQCAELVYEILKKDGIDIGESYTPSDIIYNGMRYFNNFKIIEN